MLLRRSRLLAGLVVVSALGSAPGAAASDGTFTHVFCADPATGKGVVGANGRLPDGTSNPATNSIAGVSAALSRCTGTIGGGDGTLATTGGGWTTNEPNRGAALRYRAPADLRFAGGTIYRAATMSGHFGWLIGRSGTWDSIFSTPRDELCTWGNGCFNRGTSAAPFSEGNRVRIGARTSEANGFDVSVLCDIPNGWSCEANGSQTVRVYGGRLSLEDAAAPVVGAASGSLVSEPVLSGSEDIDFAATDVGSGLYRVRLLIDGEVRLTRVLHANGGRCVDIEPENADDYEFAWQQPCRLSANSSEVFETQALPEGPAVLKLVVEDAGGNTATVVNRSVTVDNVPPPTLLAAPSVDGVPRKGSSLAVAEGTWDSNGVPAEFTYQWQRCLRDGSSCADVAGAVDQTLVLGADDVGRRLRIVETASNSEGSPSAASALTDVVTLEDGSLPPDRDGVDNDGDGQVDEPGETIPPGTTPPPGSGGHTDNPSGASAVRLPAGGSSSSSSGGSAAGTANGEGASPGARLTVGFAGRSGSARTASFGSSVTVTGRLVDEHGSPIRNAIVDVSSVAAVRGAAAVGAQPAVTGADGALTYKLPGRSTSRTLRFEYRHLRGGDVVSAASLTLRVRAAVRLAVRLRGVAVRYSGRIVSGPLPRAGKLVVLQGRVAGGSWQTFATRRARGRGVFRGMYRLKVRRPGVRLQFRARVVAEAGWPYLEVTSRAVTRRVK